MLFHAMILTLKYLELLVVMPAPSAKISPLAPRYRTVNETHLTQAQFDSILCPNLRTGVRMGLLEPDKDGWVSQDQLKAFLRYLGVPMRTLVSFLLIDTGVRAPIVRRKGYVNLLAFHDTFLDHGSSSGIFNNPQGFLAERLALLKGYADQNNSQRLYMRDIAPALNRFHQCPFKRKSAKGTNILSFEFAGLLAIYGRRDPSRGENYFTEEDIEDLWRHNRFPSGWQAPEQPQHGTWRAFLYYLRMMRARIKAGWRNLGSPIVDSEGDLSSVPTPKVQPQASAVPKKQKDEEPVA